MILGKWKIPTGFLFTGNYSKGTLETLSIGDYGKHHNVKADFLGYSRPLHGVANTECMPLSEKWVITVSTQYGCSMKCNFCDVPNVQFHGNATFEDLKHQVLDAISLFPDVKYTERLNIHFARMGEPIFNKDVFDFARNLAECKHSFQDMSNLRVEVIHPVLTTSLPKLKYKVRERLLEWCDLKNFLFNGQAGLQLSINSTSESQRDEMFGGKQLSLEDVSSICKDLPPPLGRKYCLNFAYASGYEVDGKLLAKLFSPNNFMCKITPIHNNNACRKNGIETLNGYKSYAPYEPVEKDLLNAGFDVLVFVPSMDEEDGLVTCGNAVLGGGELKTESIAEAMNASLKSCQKIVENYNKAMSKNE